METYRLSKTDNTITIDFNLDYFLANCNDATIDFDDAFDIDALNGHIAFSFSFIGNDVSFSSPIHTELLFDQNQIEQLFNSDILAALIATDSRFDNNDDPY